MRVCTTVSFYEELRPVILADFSGGLKGIRVHETWLEGGGGEAGEGSKHKNEGDGEVGGYCVLSVRGKISVNVRISHCILHSTITQKLRDWDEFPVPYLNPRIPTSPLAGLG